MLFRTGRRCVCGWRFLPWFPCWSRRFKFQSVAVFPWDLLWFPGSWPGFLRFLCQVLSFPGFFSVGCAWSPCLGSFPSRAAFEGGPGSKARAWWRCWTSGWCYSWRTRLGKGSITKLLQLCDQGPALSSDFEGVSLEVRVVLEKLAEFLGALL